MWIPPAGARCDEGELLVATRLEQMVGSVTLVDGPDAPEGSHDFDVHVEGDVWAMEVTSTTNGPRRQVTQEIRKRDLGSLAFDGPGTWLVWLEDGATLKALESTLPPLIHALIARGEQRLSSMSDFRDPLVRKPGELGLQAVFQIGQGPAGRIVLTAGTYGGTGWQGPDVDHWLAEWWRSGVAANKVAKLGRSSRTRRMLAVVLDSSSPPGVGVPLGLSIRHERGAAPYLMPSSSPPPPLTDLWLVPETVHGEGLQWDSVQGWSVLPPYQARPTLLDHVGEPTLP